VKRGQVIGVDSELVAVVDCSLAEYVVTVQGAKVQRVDSQLVPLSLLVFAEDLMTM
jgi:hypothetical protein